MKFNSKITLALTLVAFMLVVGAASAWCAMKIGEASLQGVSQPDTNPTKKLAGKQNITNVPQEFVPIDEKAIIKQVKSKIDEITNQNKSNKKANSVEEERVQSDKSNPDTAEKTSATSPQLSLKAQAEGVTLEVLKVKHEGDYFVLDVTLTNQGKEAVKFLYSFLEVKDSDRQPLSAIVEKLPEELPANGQTFSGIVRIPAFTTEGEKKLSLNLTDYPDQKLNLSIANIPVK
jgi:hypothetical protein